MAPSSDSQRTRSEAVEPVRSMLTSAVSSRAARSLQQHDARLTPLEPRQHCTVGDFSAVYLPNATCRTEKPFCHDFFFFFRGQTHLSWLTPRSRPAGRPGSHCGQVNIGNSETGISPLDSSRKGGSEVPGLMAELRIRKIAEIYGRIRTGSRCRLLRRVPSSGDGRPQQHTMVLLMPPHASNSW